MVGAGRMCYGGTWWPVVMRQLVVVGMVEAGGRWLGDRLWQVI